MTGACLTSAAAIHEMYGKKLHIMHRDCSGQQAESHIGQAPAFLTMQSKLSKNSIKLVLFDCRKVVKADIAALRKAHRDLIEASRNL